MVRACRYLPAVLPASARAWEQHRGAGLLKAIKGEKGSSEPPAAADVGRTMEMATDFRTADQSQVYPHAGRLWQHARMRAEHQRQLIDETAKRVFDIVFSAMVLLLTLPLLLVTAALIRLTSPGPILYRQVRCGRHGRQFVCYKFRTMVDGADRILRRNEHLATAFTQAWKLPTDPRVTPIGKWLRRTSIDELPQLFNVLRGDMSIVGPRPVQPAELQQQFNTWAHIVMTVKPGLTGLWQVSGRSRLTYEQRIALDLEYVARRSFWYDLYLILKTIPALLSARGAV